MACTPDDFTEHRHNNLLTSIITLITNNRRPVHFYKVTSHIGIVGNEIADSIAAQVANTPCHIVPPYFCNHFIPHSNERYKLFWPYIQDSSISDLETSHLAPFPDIQDALTTFLDDKYNLGFSDTTTTYFRIWNTLNQIIDTTSSHYFLCNTHKSNWRTIRLVLRYRTGTLWTEKRAARFKCSSSSTCPLCGNEDSIGHLFGRCIKLKGMYLERHHRLCRAIFKGILNGDLGAAVLQADIGNIADCTQERLCISRYIPQNLMGSLSMPSIPDFTLFIPPSSKLPELRVVEIKTCQDTDPHPQLTKAKTQHASLLKLLQRRNPHIQVYFHVILIGQMGTIYNDYTITPLQHLGLKDQSLKALTKDLHITAIQALTSIIHTRRRLEPTLSSLRQYLSQRATKRRQISASVNSSQKKARRLDLDSTPRRCQHSSGVT